MEKVEVGQILFSLNIGNAARYSEQKLTAVKVIKVGRKYFTCCEPGCEDKKFCHRQYYLLDWIEKTEFSANSLLFKSEKEYTDSIKQKELFGKIKRDFFNGYYGTKELSLEQLQQIEKICYP